MWMFSWEERLSCIGRECHKCGRKTTLAKCVDHRDLTSLSQSVTQGSLAGLLVNVLTNAEYMRLTSVKMTWRTLSEQVQSLFYS